MCKQQNFVPSKYQLTVRDVNSKMFCRFRHILNNTPIYFCTYFQCVEVFIILRNQYDVNFYRKYLNLYGKE